MEKTDKRPLNVHFQGDKAAQAEKGAVCLDRIFTKLL
jgi:hypothetical protein